MDFANLIWFQTQFLILAKARRTRAHLSRVLVIRDKLDQQNFLVCGRATFTAFSSFVTCKPNIKYVCYFSSLVTKKFSCAASKRQARLNRKTCACVQLAELKTTWRIKITSSCLVFNSASCMHAQIFLFRRACRLLAAHENFFVVNDEKYQTCLIFGLHVTNDENAVKMHTRKFCRSNLSRITSTRDKCARVRRA